MTRPVALVLTAGLGTRLRPLTYVRAKPAFPVGGQPLVLRILHWLASYGVRDAILNLHHRAETITRIVGDGADVGVRVRYSWEHPILGSAGGPRRAFSLVAADELLIVNGDTVTDVDLDALIADHRARGADATLALVPHPSPGAYGGVRLASDGSYAGTAARGAPDPGWHFTGVQMVKRRALEGIADGAAAATIGGVYEAAIRQAPGCIRGWTTRASFHDIGTPRSYLAACLALGPDVTTGAQCRIAASSQLSRTVLWDRVVIEDDVSLHECIVADGVVVPRGSRYHRCALVTLDADGAGAPGGDRLHVSPLDGDR